ncbi:MAG TPA: ATP-binding cassette domain-containing protein [Myxococcales bacterium]
MRGFRAMAGIAGLLLILGAAQLAALAVRDEPYPLAATALALLLAAGGAVLTAFILHNARRSAAPQRSPADLLIAAALALIGGEAVHVLASTGIFFPLRMALWWRAPPIAEPPLPMMLAGTCLVGLGAVAAAALVGALWLFLYARGLHRASRAAGAVLSFAGAVPYVAFALVVRALVCGPVAFLAAGRSLALRPDEQLAYRSFLGLAPGLLAASAALGLCVGRGLWSWLEQVRSAEESSDSFLTATVRGQRPWEIVLRHGLWLRRRRDLGALLLGGFAAAILIDILSNTLIDSFRPPGFPPYPSLGAALFLRGLGDDGAPAPLLLSWQAAHVAVVLAALVLLLAQTLPRRTGRISLSDGALRIGGTVLAHGVTSAHGIATRPALQWVLGASGSGKSTLLRAWSEELRNAVVVPQDPDDALPGSFSGTDLARFARRANPRGDRVLWDLLGRLDDERVRRGLFDPFTPCSTFSRGERQRLTICLAVARALDDPDCALLFDEPTSAQDSQRTRALLDCVRELLPAQFTGTGSIVLTCHDPESLDALLGDRSAQHVTDHVLWLEDRKAHAVPWDGAPRPEGLQLYLGAMEKMLDARDQAGVHPGALIDGARVLRPRVLIGGRLHAISPEARVAGGELVVLSGPSGSGKSTLLREIAGNAAVDLGYVMQDAARALPAEMPVREALGAAPRQDVWFGASLDGEMLERPVGALSEGERQHVLFAGEVARLEQSRARLRVLLLDEPFGALDPAAHLRLMEALLGWLGDSRNAAVLVSHSPLVDLGLARAAGVPVKEWTIDGGQP